jgi:ABC-type polysaccharide/polyol phosphate export permease
MLIEQSPILLGAALPAVTAFLYHFISGKRQSILVATILSCTISSIIFAVISTFVEGVSPLIGIPLGVAFFVHIPSTLVVLLFLRWTTSGVHS